MELSEQIEKLKSMIEESSSIVFFGGAGVSTESGIPDFRSQDGLYNMKYAYPPETIVSNTFFNYRTKEFFDFYRDKMLYPDAMPNACHLKLAELESCGKLKAVVTQNIDGLHQKAGSKNVLELHGTVHKNRCMRCKKQYGLDKILSSNGVPYCDCGGIIKPEVVLYEEMLDDNVVDAALKAIMTADMLIIGGTSLSVYPAAGYVTYFSGKHLVVINKTKTDATLNCDLEINAPIGEVFSML